MSIVRAILVGSSVWIAALGWADPYGIESTIVSNARFFAKVQIPRVEGDQFLISGTNVSVSCGAEAWNLSSAGPIVQVRLWKAKLEIGEETVYDYTYPVQWLPLGGDSPSVFEDVLDPHDCVFASTHFSAGSTLTVKATLVYRALRSDETEIAPVSVTATIRPKVRNSVALWRTNVRDDGTPLTPIELTAVDAIYEDVADSYVNFGHHQISTLEEVTVAQLKQGLWPATAIFGLTHGDQFSVAASNGVGPGNSLTWAAFSPELCAYGQRYDAPTGSMVPPTNLNFFYSCSTIPGASNADLNFWMWRNPLALDGQLVNAAVMGF